MSYRRSPTYTSSHADYSMFSFFFFIFSPHISVCMANKYWQAFRLAFVSRCFLGACLCHLLTYICSTLIPYLLLSLIHYVLFQFNFIFQVNSIEIAFELNSVQCSNFARSSLSIGRYHNFRIS